MWQPRMDPQNHSKNMFYLELHIFQVDGYRQIYRAWAVAFIAPFWTPQE